MSADMGICTMPGCVAPAEWVHGAAIVDDQEQQVFPWHLCQECHESTQMAELALLESGIAYPEDELWVLEACRTRMDQLKKLEGLKKS
jgi:hypothetical protein